MAQPWVKPKSLLISCPGFCGKIQNISDNQVTYSECQACPWGTRAIDGRVCRECTEPITEYDLAFIIFHALTPFIINCLFIKGINNKNRKNISRIWIILQLLCSAIESISSIIFTLLIYEPIGSLTVHTCEKNYLHEWYPTFYNPVINYTKTMRCSSEIVYPLFSLPFANLAFNLLCLLLLRTILYILAYSKASKKLPSEPYYAVLWALPLLALVHTIFSGIIYYTFPYILLATSLGLNAFHLAFEGRKNIQQLLESLFTNVDNFITLIAHMALFGFSLYSVYLSIPSYLQISKPKSYALIGAMLPLPSMFYIFTVKLTAPPRVNGRYPRI